MIVATAPRLVSGLRGARYGEVLLAYEGSDPRIEVYNSFTLNDCPDDLWQRLDTDQIAQQYGAALAVLNGPRYWLMDGIGKIDPIEPIVRDFGAISMRRVATLEMDGSMGPAPYRERRVNRGAVWYFDAGSQVHELHSLEGRTYVMQAYCVGVDPSLTETSLDDLGARLQLPDGWRYASRRLDGELVVDTTETVATVVQDELRNTYCLVD